MPRPEKPGPCRPASRLAVPVLLLALAPALARALPHPSGDGPTGTVLSPIADLYERPDVTSPVADQAILGETVEVLEETTGFTRVRLRSRTVAWVPSVALLVGEVPTRGEAVEVASPFAHVYREPSFTASRPLATVPLGARLSALRRFETDGHAWVEVGLPDGRKAFAAADDLEGAGAARDRLSRLHPASWLALGRRFLGAPYTWGGTTPLGFDCSGLVTRILERHGVVLLRNSAEMCFREPRLVPVRLGPFSPGDLLFFGTGEKIDHMGMWAGDGTVLQATAYGVPATKLTPLSDPRLGPRLRYARRLADLPDAPRPGPLSAEKLALLDGTLRSLAEAGGATYGVVFKDLSGGGSVQIGENRAFHAASTMKTAVLLELLRRVDAGTLRLEDEVPVRNEFRSVVDGSPFTVDVSGAEERPTADRIGAKATVSFLAREMIVRSSNLATDVLVELVGAPSVQAFLDGLGAGTVKVRRGVEDGKAFEAGLNNETDAAGMATLMEAALHSPRLSERSRQTAFEILAAQTVNDQIPRGLHPQSGAVVAHKTGSISTVQHDAAVVGLPDGREFVLVLLAGDFGGTEEGRQRVFRTTRQMARAAWEAMVAP